jgi:predicted amidohydrolase YtcJ
MKIRGWNLLYLCLIVLLSFCAGVFALRAKAQSAQTTQPDTHVVVYLHGRIYTNDPALPWAEAMTVRDGKIRCVGKIDFILFECGGNDPTAETIQLKGKFVMPGFNDAHVHLGGAGADMLSVRLNGVTSVEELQKRVADAVAHHKEGEWITGSGWDHTIWAERKFPNRDQLDAVAPKNPVFLTHVSGHVAVVNSLALQHGEIKDDTPNPPGGLIERDANGEATGMLEEDSAMILVSSRIPDLKSDQRRHGIQMVLADAAKSGVTSVQDFSEWADFLTFVQLKEEGKLTLRITEWLPFLQSMDDLQNMRAQGGTTDPWLKTGALKGFVDGALGSRTAALLSPYSDEASNSGILTNDPDKLRAMAIERDKAGFQIAFHAIGDRANRVALDIFEAVVKANGPRDRRDRIEHAQVLSPDDLPRFAKLKVIASMQPSHQTTDLRWAGSRIGPDRAKGAYAWASLQQSGARLAFGTDYDVEPINPMRGLYACVTREFQEGGPTGGWEPQERISLKDCIRAYTSGSAYAQFEDGKKGELKAGEYADFIVLSDDVTKIPPPQFLKTTVLRTVVGGRVVYSADGSPLR